MRKISEILSPYQSLYAASKALGPHQVQLKRWLDAGALVDDEGNVWIKTKGKLDGCASRQIAGRMVEI